jgi:hypothetical protein
LPSTIITNITLDHHPFLRRFFFLVRPQLLLYNATETREKHKNRQIERERDFLAKRDYDDDDNSVKIHCYWPGALFEEIAL